MFKKAAHSQNVQFSKFPAPRLFKCACNRNVTNIPGAALVKVDTGTAFSVISEVTKQALTKFYSCLIWYSKHTQMNV